MNWNNQYGSNLLCGCNKQEGVVNNNDHICMLMTHAKHRQLYLRALAYYKQLKEKVKMKMNTWQEKTPTNGLLNRTKVVMVSIFVLVFFLLLLLIIIIIVLLNLYSSCSFLIIYNIINRI